MLTLTEAAWERLSQIQSTRPDIRIMRLTHKAGRVKCHRGIQKGRDRVIEHPGRPTLLLTPTVAKDLALRILDAPETNSGRRRLRLQQISG